MKEIYFREEDRCLIEILPMDSWDECAAHIHESYKYFDDSDDPGKTGNTGSDKLKNVSSGLKQQHMHVNDLRSLLEEFSTEHRVFLIDENSRTAVCPKTIAFGSSPDTAVFVEFDENEISRNIWLKLDLRDKTDVETIQKLLDRFAASHEFLIVDWKWGFLSELKDKSKLESYLLKRLEIFTDPRRSVFKHKESSRKKDWHL